MCATLCAPSSSLLFSSDCLRRGCQGVGDAAAGGSRCLGAKNRVVRDSHKVRRGQNMRVCHDPKFWQWTLSRKMLLGGGAFGRYHLQRGFCPSAFLSVFPKTRGQMLFTSWTNSTAPVKPQIQFSNPYVSKNRCSLQPLLRMDRTNHETKEQTKT